jgi:hypothetical protein
MKQSVASFIFAFLHAVAQRAAVALDKTRNVERLMCDVTPEVAARVKAYALAHDRSVSWVLATMIADAFPAVIAEEAGTYPKGQPATGPVDWKARVQAEKAKLFQHNPHALGSGKKRP